MALSFGAALVHAWVFREHAAHWWVYGAFFAGLAVAQAGFALALSRWTARKLLVAGILANVAVLGVYVWSRAVAVPFGPHAGRPEPIGLVDLAAAAAETALVGVLVAMLARGSGLAAAGVRRALLRPAAVTFVMLSWTAAAGPASGHQAPPRFLTIAPLSSPGPFTPTPPPISPEPTTGDAPVEPEPAPDPVEEWKPCTPRSASRPGALGAGTPGTARAIAYAHEGDIWLYDAASGENHRLTAGGFDCWEGNPAFRNSSTVSFVADGMLYDFDLRTGDIDKVFGDEGIYWFDWSPDGKTLAYIGSDGNGERSQLVLAEPKNGSKRVVRSFANSEGRCGSQDDEAAVTWSPDGRSLLVLVTHLKEGSDTLYVVSQSGSDIIPSTKGTYARWSPDGKTVYYREFTGKRRWFAVDVPSGAKRGLAMTAGTYRPSVSPDGSALAYDGGSDGVASFVYDLAAGQERKVSAGRAAPVWLTPDAIVVSNTKACDDCMDMTWQPSGTSSRIDVASGSRRTFPIASTLDAEVLLADPAPASPSPSPSPSGEPVSSPEPAPTPVSTGEPQPSPTASPIAAG
jgi:hypothetical protein